MKKIVLFIIFFMTMGMAYSQQTVFNAPSADVTPENRYFIQLEEQFRPYSPQFGNGTVYNCYGIGRQTELNLTLFNANAPATHNLGLGTGFKSAVLIPKLKDKYPDREYKFTVGSMVISPLSNQKSVGNWSYAHLSGRVPKLNTRISAGMSYGTRQVFGKTKACFVGVVEQPITPKLTALAEWYSDDEQCLGYLISGFNYKLPKDQALIVGYQIPNSSQVGLSGFVVQYSKLF